MPTRIKALGTFRNEAKLPNGIVRRGRTVEVSDDYAQELIDAGKAVEVEDESEKWQTEDLPEDCPKYDTLKEEDIHTLGDLAHYVENDLLGDIKGIGPARSDAIEAFLEETVSELA